MINQHRTRRPAVTTENLDLKTALKAASNVQKNNQDIRENFYV